MVESPARAAAAKAAACVRARPGVCAALAVAARYRVAVRRRAKERTITGGSDMRFPIASRLWVVAVSLAASLTVVALSAPAAVAADGGGAVPNPTPNPNGVPGSHQALTLLGGASFVALVACVGGLLISAARHQVAVHRRQPDKAAHTLHGMEVSGMGALAAGGVHALVAFFFNIGAGIQ
jgi:hypothetical protein